MAVEAYRWQMIAPDKPLAKAGFDPFPPPAGEVVVEISGCGVCHTDLGYYYDGVRLNHELPLALGHEISGRVVACGEGAQAWQGKTVLLLSVTPCGRCDVCKRGKGTICPNQKMPGNDIQGGFATHIVVPAHGLCPVDEARLKAVGLELADVSVVADALTTPYQAAIQAGIGEGDFVVVVGVGGVGGYAVQTAAALGATVAAIDVDAGKLEKISGYGAAITLNPKEHDTRAMKSALREFALNKGLRRTEWIIMECSGSTGGQTTAFGLLNHGATLCVVGFTMDRCELRLSNLMAFHARALGNWGCLPELYPDALELVLDGKVKVGPFVERHPLGDINQVFAAAHDGALKRRAILIP